MIDQFTSDGLILREYIQKAMQKAPQDGFLVIHGRGVPTFRSALYHALRGFHERAVYPYDYSWLRRPYNRVALSRHLVLISDHTDPAEIERDKLLTKQLLGEDAKMQGWEGRLTGVVLCLRDGLKPKFKSRKLKAIAPLVEVDAEGAELNPSSVLEYLRTR